MELKHLHQVILTTRKQLAPLYDGLVQAKLARKFSVERNHLADEYFWHNEVNTLKKRIAKLVKLQLALKSEVQGQLVWERTIRAMQKSHTVMDELVTQAQELGMGYAEWDSGMAWDE